MKARGKNWKPRLEQLGNCVIPAMARLAVANLVDHD